MRRLSQILKLNARAEIANDKPLDALVSLRTQFALARVFRHHPTLIANLIGIAVGSQATDTLTELVQLPDCPNLFWALADLPRPFTNLRQGVQGEIVISEEFRPLVTESLSDADLARIVVRSERVSGLGAGEGPGVGSIRVHFALRASDPARVATGRQYLLSHGVGKSLVESMSELQVVLAADYRRYEVVRDQLFTWFALPYSQSLPGMRDFEQRLKADPDRSIFSNVFLPALAQVVQSAARLDQNLATLQVIEALRYHAAQTGSFPAKLADIDLPLPADPVSGKPFGYSLQDGVATITQTPSRRGEPSYNREYVVTLRK